MEVTVKGWTQAFSNLNDSEILFAPVKRKKSQKAQFMERNLGPGFQTWLGISWKASIRLLFLYFKTKK